MKQIKIKLKLLNVIIKKYPWVSKFLVALIIATFLFFINSNVFNKIPLFLDEEISLMREFHSETENIVLRKSEEIQFLIINVDKDIELIEQKNDQKNHLDPKEVRIDREKLYTLLKIVQENELFSNIDLMVIDINLDENDKKIIEKIKEIEKKRSNCKIVIGSENTIKKVKTSNVKNEVFGGYFYSYQPNNIYGNKKQNLAEEMVRILYPKIKINPKPFIPTMFLIDSEIYPDKYFFKKKDYSLAQYLYNTNDKNTFEKKIFPFDFEELGVIVKPDFDFSTLNEFNKQKKNIVFLGSFGNSGMDEHETYRGKIHGSTIIINIFYNLLNRNQLNSLKVNTYILFGIILIFQIVMFKNELIVWIENLRKKIEEKIGFLKNISLIIFKIIVIFLEDFLEFVLLILFGNYLLIKFGSIINIPAFFIIVSAIKYFEVLRKDR